MHTEKETTLGHRVQGRLLHLVGGPELPEGGRRYLNWRTTGLFGLLVVTFCFGAVGLLTGTSDAIFEAFNRMAGRSWVLDNVVALPLENPLVKAALLGGCFLGAWHRKDRAIRRNRRVLIVTLIASACVVATTQLISHRVFHPRPFIESQKVFHLDDDRLVESHRVEYRVPLDEKSKTTYQSLLEGNVVQNDLGSFPSDHAGFFVTFALGIFLVSRRLGWLALGWTFVVILGSRIVTGQHSPLDVVAGAGIGAFILMVMQLIFEQRLRGPAERLVDWTLRHETLATVIIFIAVFEAVNTLQNMHSLTEIAAGIAGRG